MCNFKSRLFFRKEQYSNKTCEQNTALPRFCFLQAIARCCICNFEPHKRMRLMWHLLKMQSNASPSEESCIMDYMDASRQPALQDAIYGLCNTHHRNCILQDARGQLSFAICNVFKMHHRKHGLRDACDWFPLQGASGRLGLPSYGGVEYWVVGGGGGGWGDFDQNIFFLSFLEQNSCYLSTLHHLTPQRC